ncbi:hypothetical protein ACQCVE_11095 [Metabacillus sp. 113a]|uniref:hypothetical protein n=1 Tax=Metabacillus sp. 113a TaxID=3404706 RepID=UPI003CF1D0AB
MADIKAAISLAIGSFNGALLSVRTAKHISFTLAKWIGTDGQIAYQFLYYGGRYHEQNKI